MSGQPTSESAIFRQATKLPPDQRATYLEAACGDNLTLRHEVESLLRAHDPDGSFLQSPAVAATLEQTIREKPGTMIGPYKLREQIGEGGFGIVYVAEQETPVRRKVALKIIKPGMDSREVIARFTAEQQALALMDHPHVARVLDAGATPKGRPYFVMELVQGVAITEFCDKNSLPTRERLKLLVDVCRAVQHAHQKGIIHRDIKPSNIMITLHDGKPVVKVIDFGISKALNQQLTEMSIYTAYGQMIGTPAYMSPEQAEMSGLGIDTRSDIYSLGVLLYELLAGETPLDAKRLRSSAYAEVLRIIREEEPSRPSQKVSTLGAKATIVAKQRHTDAHQLRRELSGELDWIVMKCLEKERGRRYDTATGLARDIERYLADEAVEACPPSFRYRLGKIIRRNRGPMIAASLIVAALCAGMIGTTYGLLLARSESARARRSEAQAIGEANKARESAQAELVQRQRADSEAAASKAVRDFLQEDLLRGSSELFQAETISPDSEDREILIEPTVKQLLVRAAHELAPGKIEAKLGSNPYVQAEVLKAVGDALLGPDVNQAIELLNRSLDLYRDELGDEHPATLSARHSLGIAMAQRSFEYANEREASVSYLEDLMIDRIRILGPWHDDTLLTRDFLGRALLDLDPRRAVIYFQKLRDEATATLGAEHLQTLKSRYHLAEALAHSGRLVEGIAEMEELSEIPRVKEGRPDHPYFFTCEAGFAMLYERAGKIDKSVARLQYAMQRVESTLGRDNVHYFTLRHLLGWVSFRAGRVDDAIAAFEQNVLDFQQPSRRRAMALAALAHASESRDLNRSLELYEQSRLMRLDHSEGVSIYAQRYALDEMLRYVRSLFEAGEHAVALRHLDDMLAFNEQNPGLGLVRQSDLRALKLRNIEALGDLTKADAAFSEMVAKLIEENNPELGETLRQWALVHERNQNFKRAAEISARNVAFRRTHNQPNGRLLDEALRDCGRQLIRAGQPAEAEPLLREAIKLYEQRIPGDWMVLDSRCWLACSIADQPGRPEAEQLLLESFRELTEHLDQTPIWGRDRRLQAARRLVEYYRAQDNYEATAHWEQRLKDVSSKAQASN